MSIHEELPMVQMEQAGNHDKVQNENEELEIQRLQEKVDSLVSEQDEQARKLSIHRAVQDVVRASDTTVNKRSEELVKQLAESLIVRLDKQDSDCLQSVDAFEQRVLTKHGQLNPGTQESQALEWDDKEGKKRSVKLFTYERKEGTSLTHEDHALQTTWLFVNKLLSPACSGGIYCVFANRMVVVGVRRPMEELALVQNSYWGMFFAEFFRLVNFMFVKARNLFPCEAGYKWSQLDVFKTEDGQTIIWRLDGLDKNPAYQGLYELSDAVQALFQTFSRCMLTLLDPVGPMHKMDPFIETMRNCMDRVLEKICSEEGFLGGCDKWCGSSLHGCSPFTHSEVFRAIEIIKSRGRVNNGAFAIIVDEMCGHWVSHWFLVRDVVINLSHLLTSACAMTTVFRFHDMNAPEMSQFYDLEMADIVMQKGQACEGYRLREADSIRAQRDRRPRELSYVPCKFNKICSQLSACTGCNAAEFCAPFMMQQIYSRSMSEDHAATFGESMESIASFFNVGLGVLYQRSKMEWTHFDSECMPKWISSPEIFEPVAMTPSQLIRLAQCDVSAVLERFDTLHVRGFPISGIDDMHTRLPEDKYYDLLYGLVLDSCVRTEPGLLKSFGLRRSVNASKRPIGRYGRLKPQLVKALKIADADQDLLEYERQVLEVQKRREEEACKKAEEELLSMLSAEEQRKKTEKKRKEKARRKKKVQRQKRKESAEQKMHKLERVRSLAATLVQSRVRGVLARRRVRYLRDLQALAQLEEVCIRLQAWTRGWQAREKLSVMRLLHEQYWANRRQAAGCVIRAWARKVIQRRRLREVLRAGLSFRRAVAVQLHKYYSDFKRRDMMKQKQMQDVKGFNVKLHAAYSSAKKSISRLQARRWNLEHRLAKAEAAMSEMHKRLAKAESMTRAVMSVHKRRERRRSSHQLVRLQAQLEWFCIHNFPKDGFLQAHVDASGGIPVSLFLSFPTIAALVPRPGLSPVQREAETSAEASAETKAETKAETGTETGTVAGFEEQTGLDEMAHKSMLVALEGIRVAVRESPYLMLTASDTICPSPVFMGLYDPPERRVPWPFFM